MANIKQQKKRVRQDIKRRQANQIFKSGLKSAIKNVEKHVAAGEKDKAFEALNLANKKLDKALTRGIYHKKAIARRKSRLQKQVNEL